MRPYMTLESALVMQSWFIALWRKLTKRFKKERQK